MRYDMSEVQGQDAALAVIERAVALRENVLLQGPPGTCQSMIARRITTIMPPLDTYTRAWLAAVYEVAGFGDRLPITERPFRAPHHTISSAALSGGSMRIAELQLASFGVLYLDELPEFRRDAIESLAYRYATAERTRPIIVASATPCPCGWHGRPERECKCSDDSMRRHTARVAAYTERLRIQHVAITEPMSLTDLRRAT